MRRGMLAIAFVSVGCNPTPPAPPAITQAPPTATFSAAQPPTPSPPAPEPPPDPRPPALHNPDPHAFLTVEGHGEAVVSLPLGTRDKRPVVLATHGNYDTPEWQCSIWRDIIENDAFVLCPRGVLRGDSPSRSDPRYQYASNSHLEKEIDAALDSLRSRFPDYVDDGPMVYTGFSQGAIMGAAIMARHPDRYPRAVLIEGGNKVWYAANAKRFGESGGKRILFACGQWDCKLQSEKASRQLEAFGVAGRVVFSKGEGHTYGGGVATEITAAFDWLVEDDPRWDHRRARRSTALTDHQ